MVRRDGPHGRQRGRAGTALTLRRQFDEALAEWNRSVAALDAAVGGFMDEGLQTLGGTWVLTMNQPKGDALEAALERVDQAKGALDRIIRIVREMSGDHLSDPANSFRGPADSSDGIQ